MVSQWLVAHVKLKAVYILVLLAVITIDYCSGLYIERSVGRRKRIGLVLSIASNIGILFVFKYYNFAVDNLNDKRYWETQNYFESRVTPTAPALAQVHGTPGYPIGFTVGLTFRLFEK